MNSESEQKMQELPSTLHACKDSQAPRPTGRSLVICLDGTGDKFDNDNSNVVNFVACLKKDNASQVTYYQSGIGTYDSGGLSKGLSAGLDMAVGSGLGVHIIDAYRFLMENYHEGDRICLLGFSRGAYTVRCLAGMLHKVGLLPAHNRAQVVFAYNFYKNDTPDGWKMSAEFKRTFCTNVTVYFIGVWDCVASVGFIPRELPFSKSPQNNIRYFRHAMALDEHRAKFKTLQWRQQNPAAKAPSPDTPKAGANKGWLHLLGIGSGMGPKIPEKIIPGKTKLNTSDSTAFEDTRQQTDGFKLLEKVNEHEEQKQRDLEQQFEEEDETFNKKQVASDVSEVWFVGAHADIGGGAVPNEERHMLSRIPLRWMIRQCFECDTGILFDTSILAEAGLDVHHLWPVCKPREPPAVGPSPQMVESYEAGALPHIRQRSFGLRKYEQALKHRCGQKEALKKRAEQWFSTEHSDLLPEEVEDCFDAMANINDQLEAKKGWWILELWPIKVRVLRDESDEKTDGQGNWKKVVRWNMGRFREVRDTEPKMHWTVQKRMAEKGYKVRCRLDKKHTTWHIAA